MNKIAVTLVLRLPEFSTDIIQMIQNRVYNTEVPKLIVVGDRGIDEDNSVETSIMLRLLNLIGFDIAIISFSGIISIDKYINSKYYQTHIIGDCQYDKQSSIIKDFIFKKKKKSWFSGILGML